MTNQQKLQEILEQLNSLEGFKLAEMSDLFPGSGFVYLIVADRKEYSGKIIGHLMQQLKNHGINVVGLMGDPQKLTVFALNRWNTQTETETETETEGEPKTI